MNIWKQLLEEDVECTSDLEEVVLQALRTMLSLRAYDLGHSVDLTVNNVHVRFSGIVAVLRSPMRIAAYVNKNLYQFELRDMKNIVYTVTDIIDASHNYSTERESHVVS